MFWPGSTFFGANRESSGVLAILGSDELATPPLRFAGRRPGRARSDRLWRARRTVRPGAGARGGTGLCQQRLRHVPHADCRRRHGGRSATACPHSHSGSATPRSTPSPPMSQRSPDSSDPHHGRSRQVERPSRAAQPSAGRVTDGEEQRSRTSPRVGSGQEAEAGRAARHSWYRLARIEGGQAGSPQGGGQEIGALRRGVANREARGGPLEPQGQWGHDPPTRHAHLRAATCQAARRKAARASPPRAWNARKTVIGMAAWPTGASARPEAMTAGLGVGARAMSSCGGRPAANRSPHSRLLLAHRRPARCPARALARADAMAVSGRHGRVYERSESPVDSTRIARASRPPMMCSASPKRTVAGPPKGWRSTTSIGSPGEIPRSLR